MIPTRSRQSFHFRFEIARDFFGFEILADLTGHVERPVNQYPGTVVRGRGSRRGSELRRYDRASIGRQGPGGEQAAKN